MSRGCCGQRKLFPLITQILSMTLGLIAFILSAVTASGCEFLSPSGDAETCYDHFGLFNFNNVIACTEAGGLYSGCSKYNTLMMRDTAGSLRPAQAMGAIAATFGGVLWTCCIFMLFFKFPAWLFKTIGGVFIFCFVTQMLTLIILNHSICAGEAANALKIQDEAYQCNIGPDGVTSIMAAVFYLGLGITILVCPVPKTAVITCMGDCCKDVCGEDEEAGCGCRGEDATKGVVTVEIETTSASGPKGENSSIPGSIGIEQSSKVNDSTVTETYNDDGTVTVKAERTNPDGSTTVSITTKPVAPAASTSV